MSDVEQKARIALLQHHTSQMQSFRTYILTGAILMLMFVEIGLRIPASGRTPISIFLVSAGVGATLAAMVSLLFRVFWFGQLVKWTTLTPIVTACPGEPLFHRLDDEIYKEASRAVEKRGNGTIDQIVKQMARLGAHHNSGWLFLTWVTLSIVFMIGTWRVIEVLGLGARPPIMPGEAYSSFDSFGFLSSILLFIATLFVAIATYYVFRATKEMAHNIVRPFLVARASTPDERREHFTQHNFPGYNEQELRSYIEKRGITVENVGLGPAVNGIVRVMIDGKTMRSTFFRIYRSEPNGLFRYFYPSPTSPQIQIPEDAHEISVEAQYYDIAEKHYPQKPQRIKI